MRYREQVLLVKEEKRRVLQTLEHDALVWDRREGEALQEGTHEGQGRAAYAAKQAAIRRKLRDKFAALWATTGMTDTPVHTSDDPMIDEMSQSGLEDDVEVANLSDDEWDIPEPETDDDSDGSGADY